MYQQNIQSGYRVLLLALLLVFSGFAESVYAACFAAPVAVVQTKDQDDEHDYSLSEATDFAVVQQAPTVLPDFVKFFRAETILFSPCCLAVRVPTNQVAAPSLLAWHKVTFRYYLSPQAP